MMRKLTLRLIFLVLLCCALLIGAVLVSAQWMPRGKELAFASERDGTSAIYVLALRHGLWYRITDPAVRSRAPVWSPDGEQLVFQSERLRRFNLFLTDLNGYRYNERRLTAGIRGDSDPVWSPDGTPQIVYVSAPGANNTIFSMGVYEEIFSQQPITDYSAVAYAPDWKHGEVIFVAIRDGDYDIYAVDPTTGTERQLTDDDYIDSNPVWSPDGTRFAYQSYRTEGQEIIVAGRDGSDPVRLTAGDGNNYDPVWSPDGRHLVFTSRRDGNEELYLISVDDPDSVRRLTTHTAADRSPVWSPDGEHLAFVSYRDRNAEIYLLNVKTGTLTRLTDDPGEDLYPAWRP